MTTFITLPGGHKMLVDDVDAELFIGQPWHAIRARGTWYAQSGADTALLAHRLITGAAVGVLVDHANRNGLDNRRSNLRLCDHSHNLANRPAPANNTSGYKGVSRARSGRWVAYITVSGRKRHLGTFETPEHAAAIYDLAALEAWGEYALLNQPTRPRPGFPRAGRRLSDLVGVTAHLPAQAESEQR